MTPTEAVGLNGYIRAHFPSQPVDEYTPEALGELLGAYPLADCRAAVLAIATRDRPARERAWCSPADVRAEVRRIRDRRITAAGTLTPPAHLTDDQERDWLRWSRRQLGDGVPLDQIPQALPPTDAPRRDLRALGHAGSPADA